MDAQHFAQELKHLRTPILRRAKRVAEDLAIATGTEWLTAGRGSCSCHVTSRGDAASAAALLGLGALALVRITRRLRV
jgi:MYXO-CTERM domain-containing protein